MASIANLLRGSEHEFFDLFENAGANIVRAAGLLDKMLARYPETSPLAGEVRDCEHDGDRITHQIIQRLNQTSVTPIDREDVLQLSTALDDIVDYIEEVADYLGLYRIEAPMAQAQQLAGVLRAATREIGAAIPLIRGFKDIGQQMVEVHRLEKEGDRLTREAIASLFEGGIDPMVVIRWKDTFERLENAIDSTRRARVERLRVRLADGARTTVHVARYDLAAWTPRVVVFEQPTPLVRWCRRAGISHAIVGGFFLRPGYLPLGEVRVGGAGREFVPFDARWSEVRACVQVVSGRLRIAPRFVLGGRPAGDVLQAGPLLALDGQRAIVDGEDREAHQFDSDITSGRYPQAALAVAGDEVLAVACDGRTRRDAGMTLGLPTR